MLENKIIIPISLVNGDVELILYGESQAETLFKKVDAIENGEALYQIKEGCFYEYEISKGYSLKQDNLGIVTQSKVNKSSGRISPNIYVGTLSIEILDTDKELCGEVELEVQSTKTSYREDYRHMLEEVTEKATDLLLQYNSPVSQYFEADFNSDANTLYQRFAFVKSILDSIEFNDSITKIVSAPVTKWKENEILKDIRNIKRFDNSIIKQLASATNRVELPINSDLKATLFSVPSRIKLNNKIETVDTPENRFVKHALTTFLNFCNDFKIKLNENKRSSREVDLLLVKLEEYLNFPVFKEISTPQILPLNSPILQRKEGYREVLRVWLMFDLAAKIVWRGGDDVYSGNKRDVAILYEYWLFFKLLEVLKAVFKIEPKDIEELLKPTADGLGLQLQQGVHISLEGVYESDTRKLQVEFSYNRTFSGDRAYPESGSWTKSMRPDYTLSIWPHGIDSKNAEEQELITHIHFDAKYKVENILSVMGSEEDFKNEKEEQRKGTFKRIDLLKMHTYKDAIRRTSGAYVLYPGTEDKYTKSGFHELIPGLGAFAIRPSKINDGSHELKLFLSDVINHFMNRASQREKISYRVYDTYKTSKSNQLFEALPETVGLNRGLIPDETFVLIGYSNSQERFIWYEEKGKYIFRMDEFEGSLELNSEVVNAKFLLLRRKGREEASDLFRITSNGPKVYSKNQLSQLGYPLSNNSKDYYLIVEIERVKEREFKNKKWNFKKLSKYESIIESKMNLYSRVGLPFTVSLTELMKVTVS